MNSHKKRPAIIWSPVHGAYYQETVDDRVWSSFLGWMKDPEEVRRFCAAHDIDFVIYRPGGDG